MTEYRVIEDYSESDQVQVDDYLLPAPALIEDEHGSRALLLPKGTSLIRVRTWVEAHSSGAAIIFRPTVAGWELITAEHFLADRTEHRDGTLEVKAWIAWGNAMAPTLLAYMLSQQFNEEAGLDQREPTETGYFVNLHTHSEFSALDGLSHISELVEIAVADHQPALGLTDHGNVAGHPELQEECDAAGIKPIFGMEAYFVPHRYRRGKKTTTIVDDQEVTTSDSQEALSEYTHLCLWAETDEGLRNLWALSTEGHLDGFYGKPRIDWNSLRRHRKGLVVSTGCLRGPVAQALLHDDDSKARQELAKLHEIFGDHLYVEIHTNHLEEQVKVNKGLVALAHDFGIPLLAAVDSHYAYPTDAHAHRAWLAVQTRKDLTEDSSLFAGGQPYHLHGAEEVAAALSYLGDDVVTEAMSSTVSLAAGCHARISGEPEPPTFSKGADAIEDDKRRLVELCLANWDKKIAGKAKSGDIYEKRFEREIKLIIDKRFCGYFLVVSDYVRAAKDAGILVGPGRGSGGGSLVAYLADITGLDPVEYDLLFERFMTEGRTSLPDFDLDFPASKRGWIKDYVADKWGSQNVVTIGTVLRMRAKQTVADSLRVMKPLLTDINYPMFKRFSAIVDAAEAPLAGARIDWDDLWAQFGDELDPMRAAYPEVFALADAFIGRVKSYGKHPAGVVISTDKPLTHLPLRASDEEGQAVTQFDMVALEKLGYVKFDLLTLRTLDTIQETIDLIESRYDRRINPNEWREEYRDPQVWDAIDAGQTLGVFQIETRGGTRMAKKVQPRSIDDMAVLITVVRPGPMRSGLTEVYLRRRNGTEAVTYPDPRMKSFLDNTLGAMIYQEQVMACCMTLAGYDSTTADGVRKILGKKQIEKVEAAGREFTARAIDHGTDPAVASHLWLQMAEFAKYGFGAAHAYGYAILGYWTAWLKFHFPVEFLVCSLSTVDDDRIPEFVHEARRMGYGILPPDINVSGVGFTPGELGVRYGLASVKGVGVGTANEIIAQRPYASVEDFLHRAVEPKGSKVNRGHVKDLAAVGAMDSIYPNRRALEMRLDAEATGASLTCVSKDIEVIGPNGLPCTFDWANEVDPPMIKKRKEMVVKPPPKRCTIACRNYTPPQPLDSDTITPYTADDIRAKERELLGVWLSSTPFDRLNAADLEEAATASEVEEGPAGEYICAAIISRVTPRVDRNGNTYAWVGLFAQDGELDVSCWSDTYTVYKQDLVKDALIITVLVKNDRGITLTGLAPA